MPIPSLEQVKVGLLQFDEPLLNGISLVAALLAAFGIIVAGQLGRRLAERLRLPNILGELLIGIFIANVASALNFRFAKKMYHWHETLESLQQLSFTITPLKASLLALHLIASVGILLLMFQVGLETNLGQLAKHSRPALRVALIGMVAPFILGVILSFVLILDCQIATAMFLGGTLSATSIAVTARVLKDANVLQSVISQVVLGAAVIDDVLGMMLLAGISGWATGESRMTMVIAGALLFFVVAILIHRFVKRWPALIAILLSSLGAFSGISAIVGAFVAGALFSDQPHLQKRFARLEEYLAPVFFVVTGCQVDLRLFLDVPTLLFTSILTTVAIVGKLFAGLGVKEERTFVGVAMIPRGEMGLVFVSFGQSLGLFSAKIFGAIVLMVLLTSAISPLWLRFLMKKSYRGH